MPAIGMGIIWGGWTLGLWGWCLIRGYDVSLGQLVNPVHQLDWKTAIANQIPNTQIVPGGQNATASGGSTPNTQNTENQASKNAHRQNPGGVGGRY